MYFSGVLAVLLVIVNLASGQLSSLTILDHLTSQTGLRTFGSWCSELSPSFYGGVTRMTVFAFNDTGFNNMDATERNRLQSMTSAEKKEYIETYTVPRALQIQTMSDGDLENSMNGRRLFINKRDMNNWQPGGGGGGRTAVFVNGAMVLERTIAASNGIIMVLDRPPSLISNKNVYEYLNSPDGTEQTTTLRNLMDRLYSQFYTETIGPLAQLNKVTFFLPNEKALNSIPQTKLATLQGQQLSDIFKMHFVRDRVIYTSTVKHQDNYQTGMQNKRVVFLRNGDTVMVKSGGVTAEVTRGNITVKNGVIHIVDRMLGFIYLSPMQQIEKDAPSFYNMIKNNINPDVSKYLSTSGLNLCVPSDQAMNYVKSLPWINLDANITMQNFIVQLHMLKDGSIDVAQLNGNYDVRQRRKTHYQNWRMTFYNDRNDTWVNAGNVRARITRPDISVLNSGQLQFIDAVLGIPTMDIPTLIYYDDWLLYTYNDMKMLGLDTFLKDPRYDPTIMPPRGFNGNGDPNAVGNNFQVTQDPFGNTGNNYPNNNNNYPTNNYPNNQYPNNQYPNNQYPNNQNNQYPNNQYPNNQNNQYPNNQYPNNQNNQYPNSQYPSNNQISPFGTCGSYNLPCQFTFFCPNGTAIYDYYMKNIGNRIIQDHARYRFVLRRLIIPNVLIFIERLAVSGQSNVYTTHSGETVTLKRETDNIARIYWGGQSARVIMWDLGATNGVVHIIDSVLSDTTDINRDISRASGLLSQNFMFIVSLASLLAVWFVRR